MPGPDIKSQLTHVLWIGGATDSGKSTVAQLLAQRYGCSVFHYDRADSRQMERLAATIPEVDRFLKASIEERWLHPTPQEMFEFLLDVFPLRFQLVIEELLSMAMDTPILVEGFGLLPELLHPVLSSQYQAIWFVPTEEFKWDSMVRRGKPSFASSLNDPEKARMNLFKRDTLLAHHYRKQVPAFGYTLYEVDGSCPAEEMADTTAAHFAKYSVVRS